MAIALEGKPTGRFASILFDTMEKKEMSIKDLAEKTDATYEHIRKMLKGIAYPSKLMLKAIAKEIGVSIATLDEALTADRIEHRYGDMAHKVMGQTAETAVLSPIMPSLTPEQREMVVNLAKGFQRQNREAAKK